VNQVGIGCARAQEDRVEPGLAGFTDRANGLADDGAQDHHFAACGLHLGHLRRKVGGTALVRCFLGELHAHGFQARFTAAHDFQAEFVILVHGADFFNAFFLDHFRRGIADLVKIGRCKRVFKLVERLVHLTRRRDREEIDHVLFKLDRHGGQVLRSTDVAHHHENLVLVHQFLSREHRFLRIVGIVFDNDF